MENEIYTPPPRRRKIRRASPSRFVITVIAAVALITSAAIVWPALSAPAPPTPAELLVDMKQAAAIKAASSVTIDAAVSISATRQGGGETSGLARFAGGFSSGDADIRLETESGTFDIRVLDGDVLLKQQGIAHWTEIPAAFMGGTRTSSEDVIADLRSVINEMEKILKPAEDKLAEGPSVDGRRTWRLDLSLREGAAYSGGLGRLLDSATVEVLVDRETLLPLYAEVDADINPGHLASSDLAQSLPKNQARLLTEMSVIVSVDLEWGGEVQVSRPQRVRGIMQGVESLTVPAFLEEFLAPAPVEPKNALTDPAREQDPEDDLGA